MRIVILVVCVLAGCPKPAPPPAQPPTRTESRPPTRPPPAAAGVTVPSPLPEVPVVKVCASPTAAGGSPKPLAQKKQFDFSPEILYAGRYGARVQTRPRPGDVRSLGQVRAAVKSVERELRDCWVWSVGGTWKPGAWAELTAAITFDPFGAPSKVDVTERVVGKQATTQDKTPLAECAADVLSGIRSPKITRSIDTAKGYIRFQLIGTPPRPRPRPVRRGPSALPPDTCLHLSAPPPVHEIWVSTLLEVEAGTPPPDPPPSPWRDRAVPTVSLPAPCSIDDLDKNEIRRALYSNLGGYHACYVDALGRQPGLRGKLTAVVDLGLSGEPTRVVVSGDGDVALHTCMQDALALMFVRPSVAEVENHFEFELVPAPNPKAAREEVAAGFLGAPLDVDALVARLAAAVPAGADDAACEARVQVLRALAWVPWQTDSRVRAAVHDFADFVRDHRDLDRCVSGAADLFSRVVLGDLRLQRAESWPNGDPTRHLDVYRGAGLAEALARGEEVLAELPVLRHGDLGLFVAAARYELDDPEKALDALTDWFEDSAHQHEQVATALDLAGRIRNALDRGYFSTCNP